MDLTFVGAERAQLTPAVAEALAMADLIVFCPSNPFLSIDPILSIPRLRQQLRAARAPKVAVSPIVGGRAIKGPAAKMLNEMGLEISPLTIARHYADLLDGFVMDLSDAELSDALDLPVLVTQTLMTDLASKRQLAAEVIDFGQQLRRPPVKPNPLSPHDLRDPIR
jgi:LPPG:FO 2-phospho-L-lactate transferase